MSKISSLTFTQSLEQLDGYRAMARVRALPPVHIDEPETLGGQDTAPCPMDYLLTAVGGCLLSSLALCLKKKRVEGTITMDLTGRVERGSDGLLAVQGIDVDLRVNTPADHWKSVEGCYRVFKKYCIVTAAVARGIPVETRLALDLP